MIIEIGLGGYLLYGVENINGEDCLKIADPHPDYEDLDRTTAIKVLTEKDVREGVKADLQNNKVFKWVPCPNGMGPLPGRLNELAVGLKEFQNKKVELKDLLPGQKELYDQIRTMQNIEQLDDDKYGLSEIASLEKKADSKERQELYKKYPAWKVLLCEMRKRLQGLNYEQVRIIKTSDINTNLREKLKAKNVKLLKDYDEAGYLKWPNMRLKKEEFEEKCKKGVLTDSEISEAWNLYKKTQDSFFPIAKYVKDVNIKHYEQIFTKELPHNSSKWNDLSVQTRQSTSVPGYSLSPVIYDPAARAREQQLGEIATVKITRSELGRISKVTINDNDYIIDQIPEHMSEIRNFAHAFEVMGPALTYGAYEYEFYINVESLGVTRSNGKTDIKKQPFHKDHYDNANVRLFEVIIKEDLRLREQRDLPGLVGDINKMLKDAGVEDENRFLKVDDLRDAKAREGDSRYQALLRLYSYKKFEEQYQRRFKEAPWDKYKVAIKYLYEQRILMKNMSSELLDRVKSDPRNWVKEIVKGEDFNELFDFEQKDMALCGELKHGVESMVKNLEAGIFRDTEIRMAA